MERWDPFIRSTVQDDSLHILDDNDVFASTGDGLLPIDDETNGINIYRGAQPWRHVELLSARNSQTCVLEQERVLGLTSFISCRDAFTDPVDSPLTGGFQVLQVNWMVTVQE